jgi:hypothetical protein
MKVPLPARIYLDDALTLATSKESMDQVLASLIKAIFVVMGAPDTSVCQCSLAMDKWEKLQVAPIQTMLRLVIGTNRMTVSVPDDYIQSVRLLIDSPWHTHRQQFMVKEAQELTGKLGLSPTYPPLCIHCICPFQEQEIPGRLFSRVPNPY